MKRLLSSTIVLLLLAVPACKWLHNPVANDEPREKGPHPDIPIIRPGMTPQEIEALMGRGVIEEAPGLGKGRAIGTYRDIKVDYLNDRVLSCSSRPLTISEPNKGPTVQLYLLEKIMRLGMTHQEVEEINGLPAFGIENKPGTMALVYPKTGIEVVYVKDALKRWTKIYTFERYGN